VEFAIVGSIYLTILFFVIQGGIFYIKVTILDVATETAARAVLINGNPNTNITTPPTTGAAFAALVAQDSYGVLKAANIVVALQENPPAVTNVTGNGAVYGFTGIPPYQFTAGGTPPYQYTVYGYCPVTYQNVVATIAPGLPNAGTVIATGQDIVNNAATGTCSGTCNLSSAYANGTQYSTPTQDNEVIGGIVNGGAAQPASTTTIGSALYTFTNFTGGKYTCNSGQDVLLQVQYTDPTIVSLVGQFFGAIVSTVAFQIEPSAT